MVRPYRAWVAPICIPYTKKIGEWEMKKTYNKYNQLCDGIFYYNEGRNYYFNYFEEMKKFTIERLNRSFRWSFLKNDIVVFGVPKIEWHYEYSPNTVMFIPSGICGANNYKAIAVYDAIIEVLTSDSVPIEWAQYWLPQMSVNGELGALTQKVFKKKDLRLKRYN